MINHDVVPAGNSSLAHIGWIGVLRVAFVGFIVRSWRFWSDGPSLWMLNGAGPLKMIFSTLADANLKHKATGTKK